MFGTATSSEMQTASGTTAQNGYHLWHLMLWITCCAMALSLLKTDYQKQVNSAIEYSCGHSPFFLANPWNNHPSYQQPCDMLKLADGARIATALMGLAMAVQLGWRLRPIEPGVWLLAAQGVAIVLSLPWCFSEIAREHPTAWLLVVRLSFLIVLVLGTWSSTLSRSWRTLFWGWIGLNVGLIVAMTVYANVNMQVYWKLDILMFAVMPYVFWAAVWVAYVCDRCHASRYSWLHQLGVWGTTMTIPCWLGMPVVM